MFVVLLLCLVSLKLSTMSAFRSAKLFWAILSVVYMSSPLKSAPLYWSVFHKAECFLAVTSKACGSRLSNIGLTC